MDRCPTGMSDLVNKRLNSNLGTYGRQCKNKCRCAPGVACHPKTGRCAQKCPPGRKGHRCSEHCSANTYGQDCRVSQQYK